MPFSARDRHTCASSAVPPRHTWLCHFFGTLDAIFSDDMIETVSSTSAKAGHFSKCRYFFIFHFAGWLAMSFQRREEAERLATKASSGSILPNARAGHANILNVQPAADG